MARFLSELGWSVEVVTTWERYQVGRDESLLEEDHSFKIVKTHTLETRYWFRRIKSLLAGGAGEGDTETRAGRGIGQRRGLLSRVSEIFYRVFSIPDDAIGWLPFAVVAGWLRARPPSIVLATHPPATGAVAAALVSRLRGAHLVLDYRDPWSTWRSGDTDRPVWRRSLERRLERWCVRRASLVLTTTAGIRKQLLSLDPRRITVIPNAYDPEDLVGVEPTRFERFTVVYAGSFYASRTCEPILRAFKRLRDGGRLPPRGLALRVLGVSGSDVADLAARCGVSDLVEVEPFLPYRAALSRMLGADLLLIVVGEGHGDMIPAKLFDYLAARRPILAVTPPGSEAGDLVERLGVGRVVDPADVVGIAEAIASQIQSPPGAALSGADLSQFEARRTMADLDAELRRILDDR